MSCVNHITSFGMEVVAMYFASVEERAIVACFLHCNKIAPPTSRNMYSNVDLQKSRFPA
jgi:hypothetical protein